MTIANTLSLTRLATIPAFLIAFHMTRYRIPGQDLPIPGRWGALICFLLLGFGVITDLLDGYLARSRHEVTRMGKLLDPFADSLTFVTAFACFAHIGYMGLWMFWLILVREVSMHFFVRPFFQLKGVVLAAKKAGKFKTVMQSILSLVLLAFLVLAGGRQAVLSPTVINVIRWIFYALFGVITMISLGSMGSYLMELKRVLAEEAASR